MEVIKKSFWDWYVIDNYEGFDDDKVGKWMYFFNKKDIKNVSNICRSAIEKDIVKCCKHNNDFGCKNNPYGDGNFGVACFYLHFDDIDTHKKTLEFFLENNLIKKTKTGKLYNISFKLDSQTLSNQYGSNFNSSIKLSNFINLESGEWIYKGFL